MTGIIISMDIITFVYVLDANGFATDSSYTTFNKPFRAVDRHVGLSHSLLRRDIVVA